MYACAQAHVKTHANELVRALYYYRSIEVQRSSVRLTPKRCSHYNNTQLKTRPKYECRCDERLKTTSEKSTRLGYTGFLGELEYGSGVNDPSSGPVLLHRHEVYCRNDYFITAE